jgi:phage I-like protein
MAYGAYHPRHPRGQQRDKPYREALRMELAAAGDDMKELREIAKAHIAKCKEGDLQAIKELADRLDGKPTQILEHSDGEGRPVRPLTYQIVHVTKTQEQIDNEGLVIDHQEIKAIGNGHEHPEIARDVEAEERE